MSKEVILNWHKGRKIIILPQKDGVDGLPAVHSERSSDLPFFHGPQKRSRSLITSILTQEEEESRCNIIS